jgi:hypothetical protein
VTHYDSPPERLSKLHPGDSVDMPTRETVKLLITHTPCCRRQIRATQDEINYMRRAGRYLPYVFRACPGCRWPYKVEFNEDDTARLVLRVPR